MTESNPSAVKSADRVLDLLELLNQSAFGLSHSEIAEHLAIPKSSLSQLMKNLVARGYIEFSPSNKLYMLGDRLEELARRKSRLSDLGSIAQPTLERLTKETQESAFLNVRNGDNARLIAREISPQALVTILEVGATVPLHRTAAGRAILAFLTKRTQDDYLSRADFESFTALTVNSADELRERLEEVEREGICVAQDEFVLGVTGVSAPVKVEGGDVLGSLTISMPSVRFNADVRRKVASILTRESKLLAAQFGAEPSAAE